MSAMVDSGHSFTGTMPLLFVMAVVAHKKLTLPEKVCVTCNRPFAWRKKWARDWEEVRYCSDRCRRGAKAPPSPPDSTAA